MEQPAQVIEAPDHRHTIEPLILQRPDHAFSDGDGAMFSDCAEALLESPAFLQFSECATCEH